MNRSSFIGNGNGSGAPSAASSVVGGGGKHALNSTSAVDDIVLHERLDVERGAVMLYSAPMLAMKEHDASRWRAVSDSLGYAVLLDGYVPVKYSMADDSNGFGRFLADVRVLGGVAKGVPFVKMQREVRAALAERYVWDVDMVNCHPTILVQVLENMDIPCPLLKRYVHDRAACIAEVMDACGVTRDTSKTLFIRLVFGGGVKGWLADHPDVKPDSIPSWVFDFKRELRQTGELLMAQKETAPLREHMRMRSLRACPGAHKEGDSCSSLSGISKPHRFATGKSNELASAVAIYLQTKERECVQALVETIRDYGRTVESIIYDGVHVAKDDDDGEDGISRELLDKWSKWIKRKTGLAIKLECKPFCRQPALDDCCSFLCFFLGIRPHRPVEGRRLHAVVHGHEGRL